MNEQEYHSVSMEGGRGCGKSTVVKLLLQYSAFNKEREVYVNRIPDPEFDYIQEIDLQKENSTPHLRSLEVHQQWLESLGNNALPENPDISEKLSREKFSQICEQLKIEIPIYKKYLDKNKNCFVILDRYLDTVVVYGAAEIIISNPKKFQHPDNQKELIKELWNEVFKIDPVFPDATFYLLSQKTSQESLIRSWQTHSRLNKGYELSDVQEKIQNIVSGLYLYSYEYRKNNQDREIFLINIDDKNQQEVSKIINRILKEKNLGISNKEAILSLRGSSYPTNIHELMDIIKYSSINVDLPSRDEVECLGVSNNVYNNYALFKYGKDLLGENLVFAAFCKDEYGDNPVSWFCIQFRKDGQEARVLDIGSLYKEPAISEWQKVEGVINKRLILANKEFHIENNDIPLSLMELAYDIKTKEFSKNLYNQGLELLYQLENDSARIFWAIHFRRFLVKNSMNTEAQEILNQLIGYYPSSLIVSREIAIDILEGVLSCEPRYLDYLDLSQKLIRNKARDILDGSTKQEFLNYYASVEQVLLLK